MAPTVLESKSCGLVVAVNQKFTIKRRLRLRREGEPRSGAQPEAVRALLPWRRSAKH